MKFEHQYDPTSPKITVEVSNDATVDEAMEAFTDFLLAVGYTPDSIDECLVELGTESIVTEAPWAPPTPKTPYEPYRHKTTTPIPAISWCSNCNQTTIDHILPYDSSITRCCERCGNPKARLGDTREITC